MDMGVEGDMLGELAGVLCRGVTGVDMRWPKIPCEACVCSVIV